MIMTGINYSPMQDSTTRASKQRRRNAITCFRQIFEKPGATRAEK
jgi:hypothetical protein